MVLSLVELSLISLRDNLEAGIRQNVHQMPQSLREELLKLVLMHGSVNKPVCAELLGSVEFLRGFTSLNTQYGHKDDHEFLDIISKSMAVVSENNQTIGDGIKSLYLNVYECYTGDEDDDRAKKVNFPSIVRLISACPNLEKLDLKMVDYFVDEEAFDAIDNIQTETFRLPPPFPINDVEAIRGCRSILENIKELSITNPNCPGDLEDEFMVRYRPIVQFKNLTSLRLVGEFKSQFLRTSPA